MLLHWWECQRMLKLKQMMQCYFEFFMECGNLITLGFLIQENYSTLIHKFETQFEFKNFNA